MQSTDALYDHPLKPTFVPPVSYGDEGVKGWELKCLIMCVTENISQASAASALVEVIFFIETMLAFTDVCIAQVKRALFATTAKSRMETGLKQPV